MTDEEEFSARSSSNGRGKAMLGYCSIADAEWGVSYLIRLARRMRCGFVRSSLRTYHKPRNA